MFASSYLLKGLQTIDKVLQSTHKRSSSYQQPGVVADSGDERAVHLPVHLPSKSVGVTRHHDLDDPPTGQSGSETEQRQRRGNVSLTSTLLSISPLTQLPGSTSFQGT